MPERIGARLRGGDRGAGTRSKDAKARPQRSTRLCGRVVRPKPNAFFMPLATGASATSSRAVATLGWISAGADRRGVHVEAAGLAAALRGCELPAGAARAVARIPDPGQRRPDVNSM